MQSKIKNYPFPSSLSCLYLEDVHTIIGGVEPENKTCRICLTKAGFTIAQLPDEEGMLRVEKKLH